MPVVAAATARAADRLADGSSVALMSQASSIQARPPPPVEAAAVSSRSEHEPSVVAPAKTAMGLSASVGRWSATLDALAWALERPWRHGGAWVGHGTDMRRRGGRT